jgi:hypothetical protein
LTRSENFGDAALAAQETYETGSPVRSTSPKLLQ